MELSKDQLKAAEEEVRRYLPRSQQVYGFLVLRNRLRSDPLQVLVDRWPDFSVVVCKPRYDQKNDHFKDTVVFANDEAILRKILRNSSVFEWTKYLCLGTSLPNMEIVKAVALEMNVPCHKLAVCRMMILEDASKLPSLDCQGIKLSSLDESHEDLVNKTWKFGKNQGAVRMIHNMIANFPSCCVLDAEENPVSWILTYPSCAIGMLYTLPEHRGKGYAKALISCMAKRLKDRGYPVFCFIEEENQVSYKLFKGMGFTEDPSHRETWFGFNDF
ncbi:glycine N-acyltransferase-like protein [Cololabis saira]|uniref:glycine N-acyltransferase-like protein n=1 Tax=Cololabis saira TaxID=129043 RepID=UPI002AD2D5F5|nr:glycine N-acyltransferase-like protein [Cololabis saira]